MNRREALLVALHLLGLALILLMLWLSGEQVFYTLAGILLGASLVQVLALVSSLLDKEVDS